MLTSRISALLVTAAIATVPAVAVADHLPSAPPPAGLQAGTAVLSEGDVRFITNVQAAHGVAAPLGEHGSFKRDGKRYLATSSTIYGLEVVDVSDPVAPKVVGNYATASGCPTATPEAVAHGSRDPLAPVAGWENDISVTPDGRIAILGMDAAGRCHDPDYGGLELVDISDVTNPRVIHLTRNVGESHSVTIDPERPWLAYLSTSDNDDFIDVVDFKSCLGGVAEADACRPMTARIVFESGQLPGLPGKGQDDAATYGCHDIRMRGDLLFCAAVDQTSIIDVGDLLDGKGRLAGTHLDCPLADATRATVKVTDCSAWTQEHFTEAKAKGAKARMLSLIEHDGSKPPEEDIDISHQAEAIENGKIMFVTDERGGGLGTDACPGGGVWFYDIRDPKKPRLMRLPDGGPAVLRTENNIGSRFSCTVHYGQQFGDERILTFAWYTNGMRVFRYTPDFSTTPATISFTEVGAYLPVAAWTIQAKGMVRNPEDPDELIVYTADASRGLDVFGVKVPAAKTSTKPKTDASDDEDGTQVLGEQTTLPKTGSSDGVAFALIALAAAVAGWTRRAAA